MANPANLKLLAEKRLNELTHSTTGLLKKAQDTLVTRRSELQSKRDAVSKLADELGSLRSQIAEKRRAIAAADLPSNIEALAGELETLLIRQRNKRSLAVGKETEFQAAETDADLAADAVTAIEQEIIEITATLETETTRKPINDELHNRLDSEPLKSLYKSAEAVLTNGPTNPAANGPNDEIDVPAAKTLFQTAKNRVSGDIPVKLRDRAVARRKHVADALNRAQDLADKAAELLAEHQKDHDGTGPEAKTDQAKVAGRREVFEKAELAFRDYAQTGLERFEAALSLLRRIESSSPLTQAEKDEIASLATKGEAASDLEKARDDKREAAAAAKLAVDRKKLEVDAGEADATELTALQTALTTAEGELTTAEAAFDGNAKALDRWEAAVPASIWSNLADLEQAREILASLQDPKPNKLQSSVRNAEKKLIEELLDLQASTAKLRTLNRDVARATRHVEHLEEQLRTQQLSALLGETGT